MKNRGKEQFLARRLSFRELDFVDTVEASIEHSYPNKFEFVNQLNYIGIKVKGSHFSPFLFKKPGSKLIFHYFKAETKSFENTIIKHFDSGELDFIVDTIKKRFSENDQINVFQNDSEPHFLGQANEKEHKFLIDFKRTVEIMYPKTFSFVNRIHYYEMRYIRHSDALFQFRRKQEKLLFISKVGCTRNQIVEITDYTEQYLDKALRLVVATLQAQRNEQLITAQPLENTASSFPESLETEQRRFVMSFKNIIEEHYPNVFDVFIDKKYLSFKERKHNHPLFWFMKKKGQLVFHCHPKNEDTIALEIKTIGKETLLDAITLAKNTADSYRIYAIDDKKQQGSKKEEKETAKPAQAKEPKTAYKDPQIYSFIKNEILGLDYKALPSIKALCRNVKAYLLNAINEAANKNYDNALECCEKELFFGKKLEWSAASWSRDAKVVYRYFKANTLVERIKDYEETHEVTYIKNQPALLQHLFGSINDYTPINYASDLYFNEPLPKILVDSLSDILANFKGYESN